MVTSYRSYLIIIFFFIGLLNGYAQNPEDSLINYQIHDSVVLMDGVTVEAYQVSGQLRTIPGSLSVLTGEGINLSDGISLATTINTLPGVTMQSGTYATSRIVIRGMGSRTPYNTNRIRAYLNDIPFTSSDGVSTPEEIDLESIGRMEVIKGPSSALYGSGLGGSINMYTPVKTENEGSFGVQYGNFGTGKANLSGTIQSGNTNLWGNLSHTQSNGFRENNHYERTALITTAEMKQSRWSVKSTLLLININAGIPSSLGKTLFETNPQAAAANWKAIEGGKKYSKGVAGATLVNNISESITNRLTLFGKWNDNYENRPFNNLDDQSLSGGLRNKLSFHGQNTDLVVGTEWIVDQYKWKIDKDDILLNESLENRSQLNVFSMLYYRPVPKLNLSLAGAINNTSYRLNDLLQYHGDQSGKRNFPLIFSPRIGVNYSPSNILAFYASAGHGYSFPSPEETLLPEGDVNTSIMPEQGFQYEIGTRLNLFEGNVNLDGVLYWIELNNLLLTKRVAEDIFTGMNAGKTRHQGFELLLHNQIFQFSGFPGKLRSNISYFRSLNRFMDFTDDENIYDGKHLPGIPDQTLQLQFLWNPVNNTGVMTHIRHVGNQYLNDSNTLKYQGYFWGNIRVTTRINMNKAGIFNIYAGINNFTDSSYASMLIVNAIGFNNNEPRYYYPGLPRHGYAGIKFSF